MLSSNAEVTRARLLARQRQQTEDALRNTSSKESADESTADRSIASPQSPPILRSEPSQQDDILPSINTVPTTDTLEDEKSLIFRRYAPQTPPRTTTNAAANSGRLNHGVRSAPAKQRVTTTPQRVKPQTTTPFRRRKHRSKSNRDFQIEEDFMSVVVENVSLEQRSAFAVRPAPLLHEWERLAAEGSMLRNTNMAKRLSPSYQHLELIHTLQAKTHVRQVHFSPSTSLNSDLFVPWDAPDDGLSSKTTVHDGRYRSIDPVKATVAALPSTPPLLSHKKVRLPMRSDVGFPNATTEEMEQKQREIQHETEWEEASPRLVVLVTSDDLGKVVTEYDESKIVSEHVAWNGGGLEGMPLAGPELIRAFERNARHFGQKSTGLTKFLEPDPYSMLAPPLDAIYSASKGWRPRPYHDRPAGMRYCLACPMEVKFGVGDIEPLVCSLALYSLPLDLPVRKGGSYGKISEDFYFPAGDWSEKLAYEAARQEDGTLDAAILTALFKRKSKAIFAFDPLSLSGGLDSIFVVVHIYRIAHAGGSGAYFANKNEQLGLREMEEIRGCANRVFEQFGTQLLSPLCFGLSRFYSTRDGIVSAEMAWPQGETKEVILLPHPPWPESQEAFVQRLAAVVVEGGYHGNEVSHEDSVGMTSNASEAGVSDVSTDSKTKVRLGRLFKRPVKSKVSESHPVEPEVVEIPRPDEVDGRGRAQLFVSSLSADFLQAMLHGPSDSVDPELLEKLPRIFADVTGDLGVLLHPSSDSDIVARKKSSLLRLPVPSEPGAYSNVAEFRELLPLPCRPEKHYDLDRGFPPRSLLNLLFLYPRLIRLVNDQTGNLPNQLAIRVRILQTITSIEEDTGRLLSVTRTKRVFNNPSSWAGSSLVEEVYTVIHANAFDASGSTSNLYVGIPMRDEFKARLPLVLDGSFALHFGLFSVEVKDGNLAVVPVAEALVPLSSTVSRDSSLGRVTTIIPNGNHRLKLGDYQLQLETRLVSSVHVGDPAVATILRDFPYARGFEGRERGAGPGSTISFSDSVEFDDSFPSLLSETSPSNVLSHFDALFHLHLCNLVSLQKKSRSDAYVEAQFLMSNMQSLFEVLRKARLQLQDDMSPSGTKRLNAFIKAQADLFDERIFSNASPSVADLESSHDVIDTASDVLHQNKTDSDGNVREVGTGDTGENQGAVRIKRNSGLRDSKRVSRLLDASGPTTSPFSRTAYGATKMDRMRIEAELADGVDFGHLYDDDDTIATTPTLLSSAGRRNLDDANINRENHMIDNASVNSIVRSAAASAAPARVHDANDHFPSGTEFAQRMRSAAQVILAPCVGPSLSSMLAKAGKSPTKDPDAVNENLKVGSPNAEIYRPSAGSDDEDDAYKLKTGSIDGSSLTKNTSMLRGPVDGPVLLLSTSAINGHEIRIASGEYIYESVIMLWLKAWLDHIELSLTRPLETPKPEVRGLFSFAIPVYDFTLPSTPDIFTFYAHLDFLLPLCLKSIVLRYSAEVLSIYPESTKATLDESHILIFEPFVEMLARGLIGQVLEGLGTVESRERSLIRALDSARVVMEFLVGLFDVLHPEHLNVLLRLFFRTLRESETEHLGSVISEQDFEWTEESLHRVRGSRQIRIYAAEVIATLPSFLALNYPMKYKGSTGGPKTKKTSWRQQYMDQSDTTSLKASAAAETNGRLPQSGWLSDIVVIELLSICSLSSEAVVAEAMAHVEVSKSDSKPVSVVTPSLRKRPGAALKRTDLLVFQSLAIHAISCLYELVLRRNAMDRRFQKESCRGRIAGLVASPILDKSLSSSRWLARMESTHKVRSIWLLCFVFILQEAPEAMLREYLRVLGAPKDPRIHRFVRLLRMCTSTFQSFVHLPRHALFASDFDMNLSPWLLQESFNTVCAATNAVVEECVGLLASAPGEQEKLLGAILDLLLQLLSTPQSSVTHLRAIGGALQTYEKMGPELFLTMTGTNIQHWLRVMLGLMNSTSLSVRSIAVDYVIALLGGTFENLGNVDFLTMVMASVLPEVAAREIALYSVSGHIASAQDMARAIWPLRRSIADLAETNPLDDSRVDHQLSPILAVFCSAAQAILDGVLVELRLHGEICSVIGMKVAPPSATDTSFDADEESLFEAANFFPPEIGPMQRIRWLLTLRSLHESKQQWVEAAEALFLTTKAICDSLPHLKHVWRPSVFSLWSDSKVSLWLESIGGERGRPELANSAVMDFAERLLEPSSILGTPKIGPTGKLQQPTLSLMSAALGKLTKEAVELYLRDNGFDELAHHRLESIQRSVMTILEEHSSLASSRGGLRALGLTARKRFLEDEASLRRVLASISGDMTKLAERLLLIVQSQPYDLAALSPRKWTSSSNLQYVVVLLSGKKPLRFLESTSLPPFLEFDTPCICRLPSDITESDLHSDSTRTKSTCLLFAQPLLAALQKEAGDNEVELRFEPKGAELDVSETTTYLYVFPVDAVGSLDFWKNPLACRGFRYRSNIDQPTLVEMKVAHAFPCALSRQRSVLTTELVSFPGNTVSEVLV